jgi:hypothetical protein
MFFFLFEAYTIDDENIWIECLVQVLCMALFVVFISVKLQSYNVNDELYQTTILILD